MPYSHHSHSGQFCKHAVGSLEEVVLEAIRQGFEVYGLTEHVPRYRDEDLYPEERGLPLDILRMQFEGFLQEAHRLKSLYASKITLLVGLETEFITSVDLEHLQKVLTKHGDQVEYLVGSVHHVNAIPIDFDLPTFEKALHSMLCEQIPASVELSSMEMFLSTYFDAQYELLSHFKPEIIGHFDLCRLYRPDLQFRDFPSVWEKLERNIQFAINYGALFEINAAALRKGWQSAYPGQDIMEVGYSCFSPPDRAID
jgi:histidinol-phosphatase (PHP family)